MVEERSEAGRTTVQTDDTGRFFQLDAVSMALLLVIVLGSLLTYVPVALNFNAQLLGLPWLFVMQPVVMVVVTVIFLATTYLIDNANSTEVN